MKITRAMSELISSYSIEFTSAVSFEQLVETDTECLNEICALYHQRELSLEQVQFMVSYFIPIIEEQERSLKNKLNIRSVERRINRT